MSEQSSFRQASVKQVQFVESIEKRTGIHYEGVRWSFQDVSAFIERNKPEKTDDTSTQQPQSGQYNNYNRNNKSGGSYNGQQQQTRKITDKQRQYIKVLETKTGACFMGKTFEEAEEFIKANKG